MLVPSLYQLPIIMHHALAKQNKREQARARSNMSDYARTFQNKQKQARLTKTCQNHPKPKPSIEFIFDPAAYGCILYTPPATLASSPSGPHGGRPDKN